MLNHLCRIRMSLQAVQLCTTKKRRQLKIVNLNPIGRYAVALFAVAFIFIWVKTYRLSLSANTIWILLVHFYVHRSMQSLN